MLAPDALDTLPTKGEVRMFPASAEVPKWLVDLEPFHPQSIAAPIYFTAPVAVVDMGERYVILPLYEGVSGQGAMITSAQGCNVFAVTKEVRLVTAAMILAVDPLMKPRPAVQHASGFSFAPAPPKASEEPRKEVFRLPDWAGRVLVGVTAGVSAAAVMGLGGWLLHLIR